MELKVYSTVNGKTVDYAFAGDPASLLQDYPSIWSPWERGFLSGLGKFTELSDKQKAIYDRLLHRADFYAFAKNNGWKDKVAPDA